MEKGNFEFKNGGSNPFSPKIFILLFVLIVLVVPFFESKRVIEWEIQRETQNNNIFHSLIFSYASGAEKLKAEFGLNNFFGKRGLESKQSPKISQAEPVIEEKKSEVKPARPEAPFRILIIGDSFIFVGGGVGEILEKELLNYKDTTVNRVGNVSSGLSRPDYFDWNLRALELVSQYNPNIVVVMIGANDAQTLTTLEGKAIINYGINGWNEEYLKRVSGFLDIFKSNNSYVFWMGLPIMKEKKYSERIKNLDSIYEKATDNNGAYFISTWNLLADSEGNYSAYLPDENGQYKLARTSDGIHLQYFGGKIVVNKVINRIKEVIELNPK